MFPLLLLLLFFFFGGGGGGEDMHDSSEDWQKRSSLRLRYPGSFFSARHNLLTHNINCTVISFNLKTGWIVCTKHICGRVSIDTLNDYPRSTSQSIPG